MRTTFGGSGGSGHSLVSGERDPAAGQDRGAHGGQVAARLDAEAEVRAELIEPGGPGGVAGRSDDRFGAQGFRDPPGQRVAAASMSAEHRNREAQRLVDADHPGILVLAFQQRRDQPDRRADGEEADDRVAFFECLRAAPRQPGRGSGARRARRGEAVRGGPARGGDADQADHRCAPQDEDRVLGGQAELAHWGGGRGGTPGAGRPLGGSPGR